jgi:predicted nucleotidyltransferase
LTKLAKRAIDLLRKAQGKGEALPAIWGFVIRSTNKRQSDLAGLIEEELHTPEEESKRNRILETVVRALETDNLDLLADTSLPGPRAGHTNNRQT